MLDFIKHPKNKAVLYAFFLSVLCFSNFIYAAQHPLGALATQHPLATEAGARVFRAGGNAFDAAVAVALTLSVVEPYNSGLGAGGLALIWEESEKKVFALDFRETAPALAHEKMFLEKGVYLDASRNGPLAIAVPGEIAGLAAMHHRWGKLPWKDLFTEAIHHAEKGFMPDKTLLSRIKSRQQCLARDYHSWNIFRKLFPPKPVLTQPALSPLKSNSKENNDEPWPPLWHQPALAQTLTILRDLGPTDFYSGKIAQILVKDLSDKGALLRLEDLQNYQVQWRKPLEVKFAWGQVWGFPLPSSGGISVLRGLNTMSALEKETRENTNWIPWLTQVLGQVFQTRNQTMGDSDFVSQPDFMQGINRGFANKQAKEILKSISLTTTPTQKNNSPNKTNGQTSHISVMDAQGNAISMTLTQNLSFGSCITAGETGILMNNQMDDFATQPGQANAYGLVQSTANSIQPGKRPLSSMAPTLVSDKKAVILAIGSPGGPRIISSVLLVLYRHFFLKEALSYAIAGTRFHYQEEPREIFLEKHGDVKIKQALEVLGLPIQIQPAWGNVQAVAYDPQTQKFSAESDPRGIGQAMVVYSK